MTDSSDFSSSERQAPIDPDKLGRTPLLSEEDVETILEATGLELLKEVDANKFGYWLNDIVARTLIDQVSLRLTRKRYNKIRKSIETYRDLSRSFVHGEFPPPLLPADWVKGVDAWIAKAEEGLDGRPSGGAAQNVEQLVFLPKALGLVHAGFGVAPGSRISQHANDEAGAAFRFIKATYKRVNQRIAKRGFCENVHRDLAAKAKWLVPEDDALRKRLMSALEYRMDAATWLQVGPRDRKTKLCPTVVEMRPDYAWRIYSRQFRDFMLRSRN